MCVSNVISAFENAANILQRIDRRREASHEPPLPGLLQQTITEASHEIEREAARGIARFPGDFERRDLQAVTALQQTTIQLQNGLLQKLYTIEDGPVDFAELADAADQGRDNAMTTLMALPRRLA